MPDPAATAVSVVVAAVVVASTVVVTVYPPGRLCARASWPIWAELSDELRHPHARGDTCATKLHRAKATVADMRVFVGHASVKTSVNLASGDDRREHAVRLHERDRSTLDGRDPHEPAGC